MTFLFPLPSGGAADDWRVSIRTGLEPEVKEVCDGL